ncbi:MAG TPA: ABC transporter permease [Clostridiaceae bacterium]|nr:ABC transporter permease [Clostridiaceae bacterium]
MDIKSFIKKYGVIVVLLLLIGIFSLLSPAFLTVTNIINIARQVSMLGIVSVGVTFVMISGGMDLSVGAQVSLVGMISAWSMLHLGISPVVAAFLGIFTGVFLGFLNGFIAIRMKIHPLIVTLASMTIFRGISYIICGGLPIFGFPESFTVLGQGYLGVIPIPVIVLVLAVILGSFILNSTYFGRYFYAMGGNEEAARLSGISINKLKVAVYTISGFFAGISGVILLSRVNSAQPNAATGYEFDVMTAAVLGGISIKGGEGKILGVFIGVLIMGVLSNGLILMNVGDYYQNVIKGLVLILAVAFDSMQNLSKKKKLIQHEA